MLHSHKSENTHLNPKMVRQSNIVALCIVIALTCVSSSKSAARHDNAYSHHDRITMESLMMLEQGAPSDQFATSRAGTTTTTPRTDGGRTVPPGTYPNFVYTTGGMGDSCSGTLIHNDIVLTSAECAADFNRGASVYDLTSADTALTPIAVGVQDVLVHPNYDANTLLNNIMLVKLNDEPKENMPLMVLDLSGSVDFLGSGAPLAVIGLEGGNQNGLAISAIDLTSLTMDECLSVNPSTFCPGGGTLTATVTSFAPDTQLCAATGTGTLNYVVCAQDTGAPLIDINSATQVAIVTRLGCDCNANNQAGSFTKVSAYTNFIQRGICDLSDVPPVGACDALNNANFTSAGPSIPAVPTASPVISIIPSSGPSSFSSSSVPFASLSVNPALVPTTTTSWSTAPSGLAQASSVPSLILSSAPSLLAAPVLQQSIGPTPSPLIPGSTAPPTVTNSPNIAGVGPGVATETPSPTAIDDPDLETSVPTALEATASPTFTFQPSLAEPKRPSAGGIMRRRPMGHYGMMMHRGNGKGNSGGSNSSGSGSNTGKGRRGMMHNGKGGKGGNHGKGKRRGKGQGQGGKSGEKGGSGGSMGGKGGSGGGKGGKSSGRKRVGITGKQLMGPLADFLLGPRNKRDRQDVNDPAAYIRKQQIHHD